MKIQQLLFTVFFFLFLTTIGCSQSFYKIDWESNDESYEAFVVYFSKDTIDVRVKYYHEGVYTVAKFKCHGYYVSNDDGTNDFWFDGYDPEIVYPYMSNVGYSADNFVFRNVNSDGVFEDLYTIDDAGLSNKGVKKHSLASITQLNPQVDFTDEFIISYFEEHEPEYDRYLAIGHMSDIDSDEDDEETSSETPMNFHLILAMDTDDWNIGESTSKDMADLTAFFTKISRELDLPINITKIYGEDFTRNNIINSINELSLLDNDVVLFYYSGHGYNSSQPESNYPEMVLDGPDYGLANVYNLIVDKGARLSLIFGDLCNSIPETKNKTDFENSLPLKSGSFFDRSKLERLFVRSSGTLIASSSKKGQFSYCMSDSPDKLGNGHFTFSLINSIQEEASAVTSNIGDWVVLTERSKQRALEATSFIRNQNGEFGQHGVSYIRINY